MAETELDQLTEQRTERLNRVKHVEKEKDELEGGKKIAESFLIQENEVLDCCVFFFFFYVELCRTWN